MEKEAKSGGDIYALVAWADAHRKQLMWTVVAVLAVGMAAGLYFAHKSGLEDQSNAAFCALPLPIPGQSVPTDAAAQQFMQVADEYPGTTGGARALLIAGQIYFEANEFEPARTTFQRAVAEYPDYPLANEAAIGVAVSLEAQGKLDEATARYEEIVHRNVADSTWPQAQSALARLYTQQNHPDRALQVYQELVQARSDDSWSMEAQVQGRELLEKHPELLRRTAAPATQAAPTATPLLNVPKP